MAKDKYPLLKGLGVLVVDDDEDSRVLMETMLRYHGAAVVAVESAKLAHQALARDCERPRDARERRLDVYSGGTV